MLEPHAAGRKPSCGMSVILQSKTHPSKRAQMQFRCHQWQCVACREVYIREWDDHLAEKLADVPSVHVWEGSQGQSDAMRQRIRHLRGHYVAFRCSSGTVVVSDVPFDGSRCVPTDEGMATVRRCLADLSRRGRRITTARIWALHRHRESDWKLVELGTDPRELRARYAGSAAVSMRTVGKVVYYELNAGEWP